MNIHICMYTIVWHGLFRCLLRCRVLWCSTCLKSVAISAQKLLTSIAWRSLPHPVSQQPLLDHSKFPLREGSNEYLGNRAERRAGPGGKNKLVLVARSSWSWWQPNLDARRVGSFVPGRRPEGPAEPREPHRPLGQSRCNMAQAGDRCTIGGFGCNMAQAGDRCTSGGSRCTWHRPVIVKLRSLHHRGSTSNEQSWRCRRIPCPCLLTCLCTAEIGTRGFPPRRCLQNDSRTIGT